MSSTQKTDESSAVLIKTDNGQQKHDYSRFEVALETRFGFALHFGFFPDFCCALAGSFRTAGERFFFSFSFLSFNASRNWELVIIAPCVVSSLVSTFFRFFSGQRKIGSREGKKDKISALPRLSMLLILTRVSAPVGSLSKRVRRELRGLGFIGLC